mmetsp:Transcript_30450/g.76453  ORF Transcript_30450/g.76453 Transcript_30450/m.76453 type:complete len:109 (-) Transcript_30450:171-497(-)|eukprot:CAMPEP_0177629526 /NCGR_PEP_ID=MMETSP0447-20121125/716_1 /TAXON_ID=0 /ORGANISM="Stygamoeba regulata, Strain BSH-02190019" /LENGTH=108 /DNA_ID=CAMNT_0019130855 /DNA_START=20 /DNA_END=346 /DNA_ORIENTATION=-
MADPYSSVVGGKLRLKGPSLAIKKKKKRVKKDTTGGLDLVAPTDMLPPPKKDDSRTEAERKFEELQRKRESERLEKMVELTHKQKIQKLNQHLDSLPTHFDIPKVGPG